MEEDALVDFVVCGGWSGDGVDVIDVEDFWFCVDDAGDEVGWGFCDAHGVDVD